MLFISVSIILLSLIYILRGTPTTTPIVSLLALVFVFSNTALLLIYLGIKFLGIIYLVIYVGAICVLFLFAIMILNLRRYEVQYKNQIVNIKNIITFISLPIFVHFGITYYTNTSRLTDIDKEVIVLAYNNNELTVLAYNMLTEFNSFIIITIMLFVAIICCINLCKTSNTSNLI